MLKSVVTLLFVFLCVISHAQELPPIEVFSPKIYGAENQNWSISQASNKFVYVANNSGLLEYNGAKWTLYPSPNETIMRSVTVVGDRIYTGCYMEFGFWEKNQFNELKYTSLLNKLKKPLVEDEQIWNIIAFDNWVLFQSLNRIYIYNKDKDAFSSIDADTLLTKIYKVGGRVYFQQVGKGLYTIENSKAVLLSSHEMFKTSNIINIFKQGKHLLVQTEDKGFFVFKDKQLSPWDIPANTLLKKVNVYSSTQLEDGSFVLGTISNGVIYLNENGTVNYKVNHSNGLSNNTVLSVFEDSEKNIWLGLDSGINCVNSNAPYRIYNDAEGKLGTIYASAIHKNNLYLGTNQGLFYKPLHTKETFRFIKGTKGQVWCLNLYDDTLFCGHNTGTYVVTGDKAEQISDVQGAWGIKEIPANANLLLQGDYNGLHVLERTNNQWKLRNKIEGFNISSKFFELLDANTMLVSHEYKGVFKLKLDDDLYKVKSVARDTLISRGLNSSLIKYKTDVLYAFKEGVFKYDKTRNRFVNDSILSQLIDPTDYLTGKLIFDETANRLWGFSNKYISYISPALLSNTPKINQIAFPTALRKGATGYENILQLSSNKYLLGFSEGYVIIDLSMTAQKSYKLAIHSIENFALNSEKRKQVITQVPSFKNNENNIAFSFSIAEYEKYVETEYQYQLEGIYDQWSTWSSNSSELFKNLPFGEYTFKVRGRVGNVLTSNVASFSFIIAKPWYLSEGMIVVYILLVLLFSMLMHVIYKNYYKKQRVQLLQQTERELEVKQLENKQQLMEFKNEKLQQDIENKNRELAISTMNLIKKNEFLNTIKKALKSVTESSNDLKSVVKIIDKNLNNTNDWKIFEQAFNNADKDFLKKIKSIHPELTPNDLKLCAYLRLNLSSKEIAPLLNISPKSVEVKRYRLRKKIGLPHESSLTNYILDI